MCTYISFLTEMSWPYFKLVWFNTQPYCVAAMVWYLVVFMFPSVTIHIVIMLMTQHKEWWKIYSYNAIGMYEYTRTGQLLPILIGTNMEEIGGSGMQVPILGVEKDKQSGQVQYKTSHWATWLHRYCDIFHMRDIFTQVYWWHVDKFPRLKFED